MVRRLLPAFVLLTACASTGVRRDPPVAKGPPMTCAKTVSPVDAAALQETIDGLPEGASLCLAPGTYPVNLLLRRSIALRGTGEPGEVVLDGGGRASVLRVGAEAAVVTIERVTIAGGAAVVGAGGIDGGAKTELTLREVVLRDNAADGEAPGAAIGLSRGTTLVERCRVVGNRGKAGAAIFVAGNARVILRSTLVAGNRATRSLVWLREWGDLVLEHATIAGNEGDAAIEISGAMAGQPSLSVVDSIVSATGRAVAARQPGETKITRSLVHGEMVGIGADATCRTGDPQLAAEGGDAFRPRATSPAVGVAEAGIAPYLDGSPSGTTAGALPPAK